MWQRDASKRDVRLSEEKLPKCRGFSEGEYDIAGFSCGIVNRSEVINGKTVKEGDVLIGLPSSGIHSNGYSLVRKLFPPVKEELLKFDEELGDVPANVLLKPTRIYVKLILELVKECRIKGIANITGGGFIENIPRIIPEGLAACIDRKSYEIPRIFRVLQKRAEISDEKMYNTFNMGIGMVLAADKDEEEKVIGFLREKGEKPVRLGKIVKGDGVIL